jgi:hypothetical protein
MPVTEKMCIGYHYFAPDCEIRMTEVCLSYSKQNVNTHLYGANMLSDLMYPSMIG